MGSQRYRVRWGLVHAAVLLGFAAARPFDLDVAVPPGSPVDWGRSFPALSPGGGAVFAESQLEAEPDERVTSSRHSRPKPDVRVYTSLGLLRILTWDLTAHLDWLARELARPPPPRTSAEGPPPPAPGEALYWVSLAPLLRLMLHPAVQSRHEVLAHMIEIGDPVLAVLPGASSEKSLKSACAALAERIETKHVSPRLHAGQTPRENMLARFAFEELLAEQPYDPEGTFGWRLFMLGEELRPFLLEYTNAGNALLRRNAASALGRYGSLAAAGDLLRVSTETRDPVVLTRALAALGHGSLAQSPQPLIERLQRSEDPIEQVALIGALGNLGTEEAVPALIGIGARALERDSDLLMSVLSALARIRPRADLAAADAFAIRVEKEVHKDRRGFQPRGAGSPNKPDRPEAPETRGEVLSQLALLARVRMNPGDETLRQRVFDLLNEMPLGPQPGGAELGLFARNSMNAIHPPARILLLETLADLGQQGIDFLRSVALSRTVDAELRGIALSQLPLKVRTGAVLEVLEDQLATDEIKAHAFAVLLLQPNAAAERIARGLLKECAELPPGSGAPELRYLHWSALRALSDRRLLHASDLTGLLAHASRPAASFGDLPRRVHQLCLQTVELVAGGLSKTQRRARFDQILDLVIASGINPALKESDRRPARAHMEGQVASVSAHKTDASYLAAVAAAMASDLLGFEVQSDAEPVAGPGWVARPSFRPQVPLEQEILLALGRTREPEAVAALTEFLGNKHNVHRATACLALGISGAPKAARVLVPFLLDEDPFTRFCAFESLRHLTGREAFTDWMYAPAAERTKAAEEMFLWVSRRR